MGQGLSQRLEWQSKCTGLEKSADKRVKALPNENAGFKAS